MDRYDRSDLQKLKKLALDYCMGYGATECHYVYRNKSPAYFSDILEKKSHIMETYIKDNSGDKKSPLNGEKNGLFFSATVEWGLKDGTPLLRSAFGSRRLLLHPCVLTSNTNVYFVDFYCMQNPTYHYVTLALAIKNCGLDYWCKRNLLELSYYDKSDNPFFYIDNGKYMVSERTYMMVELFYMHDINLDAVECKWADVQTFGRGSSTPGGLPKNRLCSRCNLN